MNCFCRQLRCAKKYEYKLHRLYRSLARHAPNRRVKCMLRRYAWEAKKRLWCDRRIYERYCLLQNGNNNVVEE